jgi:hypothetical protein
MAMLVSSYTSRPLSITFTYSWSATRQEQSILEHEELANRAALYCAIDRFHPTLLLDEGDTFLNDDPELRGVINAGHTRHTARVIRCVGEDSEPAIFSTWC